jgi:hypothetical protein
MHSDNEEVRSNDGAPDVYLDVRTLVELRTTLRECMFFESLQEYVRISS